MGKRRDYCIVRHSGYPQDTREVKHATAILEAGYSIDVICLREKGQSATENLRGVNIIRIPMTHKRGGALGYILEYGLSFIIMSCVLLYRFIRYRYKVIHVSTMPDFLVFTAIVPRMFGARVLLDLHEPTPELWLTKFGGRKDFFYWLQVRMEQWSIWFADRCITVTETLRQRFGERGADVSKIAVVSNVCNSKVFSPRSHDVTRPQPTRFTLIMHGLIDQRVGHETVVEAVSSLRHRIPGLLFKIPGQGEYEQRLKQRVHEMGCDDHVSFLGYLAFSELLETLRDADVGIVAMQKNPYSELIDTNKMYEFISMRKPVIASRLMGVEANFDETCVQLFEPGNAAELAECIFDLYTHPGKVPILIGNAYARMSEKNSWEKTRQTLLANVLALAGPPPVAVKANEGDAMGIVRLKQRESEIVSCSSDRPDGLVEACSLSSRFCFDGELGAFLRRSLERDLTKAEFSLLFQLYYPLRNYLPVGFRRAVQSFRNRRLKVPARWYIPTSLQEFLLQQDDSVPSIWPDQAEYALVLTHDVEEQQGFDYILRVASEEEKLGLRSCWNLVPYKYRIDPGVVRELKDRGHEIAIHGYKHDGRLFLSKSIFDARVNGINQAIEKWEAVGFRSEMVHRNLAWMQALQVQYDASCFDIDPYQAMPGGVEGIWPFQVGRLVELPYTLPQDHTLFVCLKEKTTRIWEEKMAFLRKHHGMALMLTHPDYLELGNGLQMYSSFLKQTLDSSQPWRVLPCDMVRWFVLHYGSVTKKNPDSHV